MKSNKLYDVELAIQEFIMTGNDFENCSRSCIRNMIFDVIEKEIKDDSELTMEQVVKEITNIDYWIDKAVDKKPMSMSEKLRDIGFSEADF